MIRLIVLGAGLTALVAIGLFPPRHYSALSGEQYTAMIEPFAHGEVPGRKLIFSGEIYTSWHGNTGIPTEVDVGRMFAEVLVVIGLTGLGLVAAAFKRK